MKPLSAALLFLTVGASPSFATEQSEVLAACNAALASGTRMDFLMVAGTIISPDQIDLAHQNEIAACLSKGLGESYTYVPQMKTFQTTVVAKALAAASAAPVAKPANPTTTEPADTSSGAEKASEASDPAELSFAEIDARCAEMAADAELMMKARQDNLPMAKLMSGLSDPLRRRMVLEAYDSPGYSTPANQKRAIAEFRDEWTVICYDAFQTR